MIITKFSTLFACITPKFPASFIVSASGDVRLFAPIFSIFDLNSLRLFEGARSICTSLQLFPNSTSAIFVCEIFNFDAKFSAFCLADKMLETPEVLSRSLIEPELSNTKIVTTSSFFIWLFCGVTHDEIIKISAKISAKRREFFIFNSLESAIVMKIY